MARFGVFLGFPLLLLLLLKSDAVSAACPCYSQSELIWQTTRSDNPKSLLSSGGEDGGGNVVSVNRLEYTGSGWTFTATRSEANDPETNDPDGIGTADSCSAIHQGDEKVVANLTRANYTECNTLLETYGQDRSTTFNQTLPQGEDVLVFSTPQGFADFGEANIHMTVHPDFQDRVQGLDGTLIVNDKSKGSTWLLHIPTLKAICVELPFRGGNHESAVSLDGTTIAVPHYETAEANGLTEGGGSPGTQVSLIDIPTGTARVLHGAPNPFMEDPPPKPHGAVWVDTRSDESLVLTAQLQNGLTMWNSETKEEAMRVSLPEPCRTPHLVNALPNTTILATGCRCSNPGDAPDCPGALALVDWSSGQVEVLDAPVGAEGLTVTKEGDIWVGGYRSDTVAIYGMMDPTKGLVIDNIGQLDTKTIVPSPMRLAYDENTDAVAVVSLVSNNSTELNAVGPMEPNIFVFNASRDSNRELLNSTRLASQVRGKIHSEGLGASQGFFITGGFDTQQLVLVDTATLVIAAKLYFPYCTIERSAFSQPTHMPATNDAADLFLTGWNNWSGGYCSATLRNTFDVRFTTLDGFNYSPLTPDWAMGATAENDGPGGSSSSSSSGSGRCSRQGCFAIASPALLLAAFGIYLR